MSAKLTLNKFELTWYLQGGMSGSHLRWSIYKDFVDIIYPQLNKEEREFIHDIALRDCSWHFEGEHIDNTPHKYFQKMLACYNPDNRYIVDYVYSTETGSADVYLYEGEYYLGWDCRISKDYITKVTKK